MKHIKLGSLDVARIGLGAMGMTGTYGADLDDAESIRTIHRAIELGVTLIDTAEIYGPFTNEELVGEALEPFKGQVTIATKFGFNLGGVSGRGPMDSRPDRIRAVAEEAEVPIVENPPLARALYASVELDEAVPPEHYKAVAQVIGYVMRLTGALRH